MKAVNIIIKFIIDLFLTVVNEIIEIIKSVFSRIISVYGKFLQAVSNMIICKNEKKQVVISGNGIFDIINTTCNLLLQIHFILMGTIVGILGIILVIKAMSMGLQQVVEMVLFSTTKNLVISLLVGLLIPSLWEDIDTIIQRKQTNVPFIWDKILDYLGLMVSYTSTVIGIIETFVEFIKKKANFQFIAGLTLAICGYFLDAATTAVNLQGFWLEVADLAGVFISLFGLILMIYSKDKDPTQQATEKISPLISMLEWIIAIGGLVKAILDTAADASTNWSG